MAGVDIVYPDSSQIVARPIEPKARRSAPTLTPEQRKKAAAERQARQEGLETRLDGWMAFTRAEAKALSETYGKSEQYYLNLMFAGGPKLAEAPRKSNNYNAWLHHLAETNQNGADVVELAKENIEDYHALTDAEKDKLKRALDEHKKSQTHGLRLTQKGRTKDVSNTCKKIEDLIVGAQGRCGIDGFYCIFRNTGDFAFKPRWWFSTQAIDEYLRASVRRFEPEKIGVLAEAFAISGANYFSYLKNPQEKSMYLKGEIRDLILEGLREATGKGKISMSYVHFTRDIELVHYITIKGWTSDRFCNPSDLSNNVDELTKLRDALKSGDCKFVRLTDEQHAEIKQKYDADVEAGLIPPRKKRKDAGEKHVVAAKKRKQSHSGGDAEDGGSASTPAHVEIEPLDPALTTPSGSGE